MMSIRVASLRIAWIISALIILSQGLTLAHPTSQSYWFVDLEEESIRSRLVFKVDDVLSMTSLEPADLQMPDKDAALISLKALIERHFLIFAGGRQLHSETASVKLLPYGEISYDAIFITESVLSEFSLQTTIFLLSQHAHQTLCLVTGPHLKAEFVLDRQVPFRKLEITGDSESDFEAFIRGFQRFFAAFAAPALIIGLMLGAGRRKFLPWDGALSFAVGYASGLGVLLSGLTIPNHFVPIAASLTVAYVAAENLLKTRPHPQLLTSFIAGLVMALLLRQKALQVIPSRVAVLGTVGALVLMVTIFSFGQSRISDPKTKRSITQCASGILLVLGLFGLVRYLWSLG